MIKVSAERILTSPYSTFDPLSPLYFILYKTYRREYTRIADDYLYGAVSIRIEQTSFVKFDLLYASSTSRRLRINNHDKTN